MFVHIAEDAKNYSENKHYNSTDFYDLLHTRVIDTRIQLLGLETN